MLWQKVIHRYDRTVPTTDSEEWGPSGFEWEFSVFAEAGTIWKTIVWSDYIRIVDSGTNVLIYVRAD